MSKNVLISGAAGGLGIAVTRRFVEAGYQVTALVEPGKDRQVERLQEATNKAENLNIHALDAFHNIQIKAWVEQQYNDQPLDIAILLVGGFAMGSLTDTKERDLDEMIRLNFKSAFLLSKHCFRHMRRGGRIFLVGARPAYEPEAAGDMVAYAISKGMVVQLADIINATGKEKGIQAGLIVPSVIDTPSNRKDMPDADFDKWIKPEEIAEGLLYAASEEAAKLRQQVYKFYGDL